MMFGATFTTIFHYVNPYHEALAVLIAGAWVLLGLYVWTRCMGYHVACRDHLRAREEDM